MAVTFTSTTWTPPGALTPSTGDVWGIADHDVTFDLPSTTWSVEGDTHITLLLGAFRGFDGRPRASSGFPSFSSRNVYVSISNPSDGTEYELDIQRSGIWTTQSTVTAADGFASWSISNPSEDIDRVRARRTNTDDLYSETFVRTLRSSFSAGSMDQCYSASDPPFPPRTTRRIPISPGVVSYDYHWLDTGCTIPTNPSIDDIVVVQVDLATQRDIDVWLPMSALRSLPAVGASTQPSLFPQNHLIVGAIAADPITSAGATLIIAAPASFGSVAVGGVSSVVIQGSTGPQIIVQGTSPLAQAAFGSGSALAYYGGASTTITAVVPTQAAAVAASTAASAAGLVVGDDADINFLTTAQANFQARDYSDRVARGGWRRLLAGRLSNGNLGLMATVPTNDELDALRVYQ